MPDTMPPDVDAAFSAFAESNPQICEQLKQIRESILLTAADLDGVGLITETLKWGQPSYLTEQSGSGSTIRLAPATTTSGEEAAALYVHCATNLIEQFQSYYPHTFDYHGKRALVIRQDVSSVGEELRHCIKLALTYKLRKRTAQNR